MTNKVIVCNSGALAAKYQAGANLIQNAVTQLIAADNVRGIQSRYVAIDDAATMQAFHGVPVTNATDPHQTKDAIDAVYSSAAPDYILLLGGPDLIPHQDIANPVYDGNNDVDQIAWSDLPYACDAPYSQNAQDFVGPTRVVGRLPDVTGVNDPAYLVNLLTLAANFAPGPPASYAPYLGVTASVWPGSTSLSLNAIFGNSTDMQVVPPATDAWPAALLSRKSHFFNCHGAATDPHFYGQQGDQYPFALDAGLVAGNLTPSTVMAAEACYGAQLYAPTADIPMGMANTYLSSGSSAYFGSTTIAYGDADTNSDADLICQYFLESLLAGASSGRAALEARQNYARAGASLSPTDLKTLAQYLLLGDPSLVPVAPPAAPHAIPGAAAADAERASRRMVLIAAGREIARTKAVSSGRPDAARSSTLEQTLRAFAAQLEMEEPVILSFSVSNTAQLANVPHALSMRSPAASEYHVVSSRRPAGDSPVQLISLLEVEARGEQILRTRHLLSR